MPVLELAPTRTQPVTAELWTPPGALAEPRRALTVVRDPVTILFVNTEPVANIARLRQISGEGLEPMAKWQARLLGLRTGGLAPDVLDVVNVADGQKLPEDLRKYDGIKIGGSSRMTNQDLPDVRATRDFIRDNVGVEDEAGLNEWWLTCFAHQLGHEAFGGATGEADGLQFGPKIVKKTPEGEDEHILDGLGGLYLVYASNSRRVTRMATSAPGGLVRELATARHGYQVTLIGDNVLSQQNHHDLLGDEMDALAVSKQAANILEVPAEELPEFIEDLRRYEDAVWANSQQVADNWLEQRVYPRHKRRVHAYR